MPKKTINVVGALIYQADKVLLAKRSRGDLAGTWEFPGGKIEENETPFQAIEREMNEELGIQVVAERIINEFVHEYEFGIVKLKLILCSMNQKNSSFNSDGSHTDFSFSELNDLQNLRLAPLDSKIVEYLLT